MVQSTELVSLDRITGDPTLWPRQGIDRPRVALFMDLFRADGANALPPIELVQAPDGSLTLADGWHRYTAAQGVGIGALPAIIRASESLEDARHLVYERALETATTSAQPLTRAERQNAVARLLEEGGRSDRDIGRLAGVAHTSVSRIRDRLAGATHQAEEPGETYLVNRAADEQAKRLFKGLEKVWKARGLGFADAIPGDRTGDRLAEVLSDAHGDEAVDRARQYRGWIDRAISRLRAGA